MKFLHAAAFCLLTASPTLAGNITIDFEQPSSFASIDQFYQRQHAGAGAGDGDAGGSGDCGTDRGATPGGAERVGVLQPEA